MNELGAKIDFPCHEAFSAIIGFEKDAPQEFPLHQAVCTGDTETIQLLIEQGIDPNGVNHEGHTRLDLAFQQNQDDLFYLLIGAQKCLYHKTEASQDSEGYYSKCLLEAKKENFIIGQAFYFEFAFLIDEKTKKNLDYFRTLAQLLELKIINLGETKFPIFASLFGEMSTQSSPTPGGFSMDSGGNTPLGKPGFYELIDTPN